MKQQECTQINNFKEAQDKLLSAFNLIAESNFVTLDWQQLRTHYLKAGTGEPIVFIHGGGCFGGYWVPLMARFEGYTMYAIDRPGFGLTDFVPHRKEWIRDDAVTFIEQALDKLGIEQPVIVANSMGSLWTFWFALERPQRVKKMIHIGCPAMLLESGGPLQLRALGVPVIGRVLRFFERPTPKNIRSLFSAMNEGIIAKEYPELFTAWLEAEKLQHFEKAWRYLLRSVFNIIGPRKDVPLTARDLRKIDHPVQFIWGENDPFGTVELGKRASGILKHSAFDTIRGGHLPWLDEPEKTAALLSKFIVDHKFCD